MKHLNDQYYGNNKLREVGTPELGGDAANKDYVDAAMKSGGVYVYRNLTGTAAKTSSPYWCARWDVADPKVTEYFDGMLVCVKVPVAGNGSYGTALQINDLGYKPIVWGLNTMITTRYPVGSVVWAVYNTTQTATLYLGSGSQTITGCWQVMDYNSDTTTITNLRRYYGSRPKPTTDLYDYALVFRKDETQVVPIHAVRNGTSGTAANTSSTGTNKQLTTESFDPFGQILLYRNSAKVSAGTNIPTGTLYEQYLLHDARYIFNITTSSLTANKELYLVVDLQSDGMVKLATDVNPWSQTLPTTNDGRLYILLGFTYDTYRYDFLFDHPIYYHDGTRLRMYTGAKIPTKTSDLTNDSNYISGPDSSEAGNIAVFGNTAGNVAADSEVPVKRLWENVDVLSEMGRESYYIAMGTGLWAGTPTTYHKIIPVKDIRKVTIVARSNRDAQYAFLKTYTAPTDGSVGTAPDYATGYTTAAEVPAGETQSVDVPTDANYLYILQVTSSYTYTPDYVKFTGIGITEHTGDGSGFVKDDGRVDHSTYLTSEDVATVAISGDYDDLANKPSIPAEQVNSDWNATSGKARILNKPTLFSGDYNDLANKPTIPAEQVNADWNAASGKAQILNKPTLFSGDYDDLTNKPVNADFGHGLVRAKVNNPSGATDITVAFTGYSLVTGGMVSLLFQRDVPAGATLNINNQGAKPIYYRESALTDGVIKANDRCLFMYNSTMERYYLIAIDRWGADIDALAAVARTGSYNDLTDKPTIPAAQVNADWNAASGKAQILNKPTLFSGDYNDLANKPTIPADKVFMCLYIDEDGYGMQDDVTINDIYDAVTAGKIVVCLILTGRGISVRTMLSDCSSDSVYFTGIGEDRLGRTVCYKLKYDQNEQEWAVSEVNIGQSPVQADWDATSGLAQILNKPAVGKVVRVCSLQGANIVESGICPPRNDGDIYIITFESANIPNTWYVCDPQSYPSFVAEEYVSPNVPTSNFQQGDTCIFIAKYVTTTNAFGLTSQGWELNLIYNDRLVTNAVTIYSGSSAPSAGTGSNGDIYIQTTA